jgi:alpha-tubulin suppressor-like RCC1 family protein
VCLTRLKTRSKVFLEPRKINFNKKCVKIWATNYPSFARMNDGKIHAWGLNNFSPLSIPRPNHDDEMETIEYFPQLVPKFVIDDAQVECISGGSHHSLALDSNGRVYSCGRNEYGRLGHGKTNNDEQQFKLIESLRQMTIVAITCGPVNSFVVNSNGE